MERKYQYHHSSKNKMIKRKASKRIPCPHQDCCKKFKNGKALACHIDKSLACQVLKEIAYANKILDSAIINNDYIEDTSIQNTEDEMINNEVNEEISSSRNKINNNSNNNNYLNPSSSPPTN